MSLWLSGYKCLPGVFHKRFRAHRTIADERFGHSILYDMPLVELAIRVHFYVAVSRPFRGQKAFLDSRDLGRSSPSQVLGMWS